jgi:hypothetical protein
MKKNKPKPKYKNGDICFFEDEKMIIKGEPFWLSGDWWYYSKGHENPCDEKNLKHINLCNDSIY